MARTRDGRAREDLETLEKMEHVKVSEGDVILLYTGLMETAVGPWEASEGGAGWHADVAYFLKDRSVSFIGEDQINDVSPTGFPQQMGLPIHLIALSMLGVDIFDNLDLERAAETAKRLNRYEFLFGRTVANREGNGLAPQSACHFLASETLPGPLRVARPGRHDVRIV